MTINSWLTVTPITGKNGTTTVSLSPLEHSGRSARTASFTVVADSDTSVTKTVTSTQAGADLFISSTTTSYTVSATEVGVQINFKSNLRYLRFMRSQRSSLNCTCSAITISETGQTTSKIDGRSLSTTSSALFPSIQYGDIGTKYGVANSYDVSAVLTFSANTSTSASKVAAIYVSTYNPNDESTLTASTATTIYAIPIQITQEKVQ